ncbi:MAG TPA: O-antigen ligase family protein [Hyphomicrobiales bacterium]|nr:O-antigen ligase family protein [Hyphomicrobiales bacterium]
MAQGEETATRKARLAGRVSLAGFVLATALLPIVIVLATRAVPAGIGAATLLLLLAIAIDGGLAALGARLSSLGRNPVALGFLALVGWALVCPFFGSPYGLDGKAAARLAGSLALVALWWGVIGVAPRPPAALLRWLQLAGLFFAGALIVFERGNAYPIRTALGLEHWSHMTNRPSMVLAVFAIVFAATTLRRGTWPLALAVFAWAVHIVFAGESESTKLLVALFAVVLPVAWLLPRLAAWSVAGGAVAAMLLVPLVLPSLALPQAEWLQSFLQQASAAHRLAIWQSYLPYIFEHPIAGYGIGGEHRVMSTIDPATGATVAAQWHPHSMLIQGWINFGLVGVLVLSAIAIAIGREAGRLPAGPRAFTIALFAGVFAVASIGHGAWQEWWLVLAGVGLTSVAVLPRHPGKAG